MVVEDLEAAAEVIEEGAVFVADEAVDEAEVIGVVGAGEEEVEEEAQVVVVVVVVRFFFSDVRTYCDVRLGRGASRGRGGGGRGRGGRGGARGGSNTVIEPHRHPGIFVAKGKEHMLVTKNLVPGDSVYGEKRISVEGGVEGTKIEYRVWNPFRSKLAAGVLGGLDDIFIKPGANVLYLGAASGTSVSHVADIVGPVSADVLSGFPRNVFSGRCCLCRRIFRSFWS